MCPVCKPYLYNASSPINVPVRPMPALYKTHNISVQLSFFTYHALNITSIQGQSVVKTSKILSQFRPLASKGNFYRCPKLPI